MLRSGAVSPPRLESATHGRHSSSSGAAAGSAPGGSSQVRRSGATENAMAAISAQAAARGRELRHGVDRSACTRRCAAPPELHQRCAGRTRLAPLIVVHTTATPSCAPAYVPCLCSQAL